MRRGATSLGVLVLVTAGVLGLGSLHAGAAKKPVTISGTVNVHGNKDVSKKANAELDMELDNFYFGPTFVKAKAGQTVTLGLENEGSAPHTFTSEAFDIDEEVSPGDSTSVEITIPSSGKAFRFYCRFHEGSGMQGAVYTTSGAKATG